MAIKNCIEIKQFVVYPNILFYQNPIFIVVANSLVSLKLDLLYPLTLVLFGEFV